MEPITFNVNHLAKKEKLEKRLRDIQIVIKGAGEMATGIAHRIYMSNMRHIVMTEIPEPVSIRRAVAFSEVIYKERMVVEGVKAEYIKSFDMVRDAWKKDVIPVIIDEEWKIIDKIKPDIVIDAIMAKRNLGTKKTEATFVIGVGPGFTASENVHVVVESKRGHNLGRVFYKGSAEAHTGIPGATMGYTSERVIRAPHTGLVKHVRNLGDKVSRGEVILYVDETPVPASINGILRGLIREIMVEGNEKIGDIDPRGVKEYCFSVSEKARAIAGGVMEAILHEFNQS